MSKIETHSVKVTKTTVSYTPEEYQEVMVAAALKDAGVQVSPAVSTHVQVVGEDVVVELLVEEAAAAAPIGIAEPEEDLGPRPALI